MTGLLIAAVGGYGVLLLVTAMAGWRGVGPGRGADGADQRAVSAPRLARAAALTGVTGRDLALFTALAACVGGLLGLAVFGSPAAGLATGLAASSAPVSALRARRRAHLERAAQAWPSMLEEIRMQTGSLGRSIPVALLDVGLRAPTAPMRDAFAAAARNWQLSNDFASTASALKTGLDSATADAVLETLLVAYEVGGNDLDRRLVSLIDDRTADLASRHDARSRQAGVRFARWFTIAVPVGMALVGVSIGDGRAAYATSGGQLGIVAAVATTALCWWWASAAMRLPDDERVFQR